MSLGYTVYLRRSLADVAPRQVVEGVRQADLLTLAEASGVAEADAEWAEDHLAITEGQAGAPFTSFELAYRPSGNRQVEVERWSTDLVRLGVEEVLDDLAREQNPLYSRVRRHMDAVIDVVSASFGVAQAGSMASVVASEVARWLADQFDGIIRSPDDRWWQLGPHGEYQELAP